MERAINVRIHLDIEILLLSHGIVAIDYLMLDPIGERVSDYGIGNTTKPCSGDFEDIPLIRYVARSILVLVDLFKYFLNPKIIVLRDVEYLDVVTLDAKERVLLLG